MQNETDKKTLQNTIDAFLGQNATQEQTTEEMDCSSGVCILKNDKSILERINKKIIIEDGRQLLI